MGPRTCGYRKGGESGVLLLIAFAGGLLSFFSPCVWPLYPAYIGQVATADEGRALRGALLFTAGFAAVFVALGASASALGQWLAAYHLPLQKVSGTLIFAFGLALAGVLPEAWLGGPVGVRHRPQGSGPWGPLLLGAAFAFGWTPCVGPVLASILLLAGSTAHVGVGAGLLLTYTLGFAVPFLGFAALVARGRRVLPGLAPALPLLRRLGGLLLAALGVLVFTGGLTALSTYLYARL